MNEQTSWYLKPKESDHPPCRLVMIVINLFLTTSVLNDVISKNIYEGKRVFLGIIKISVITSFCICTEAKAVKMIKTILISLAT